MTASTRDVTHFKFQNPAKAAYVSINRAKKQQDLKKVTTLTQPLVLYNMSNTGHISVWRQQTDRQTVGCTDRQRDRQTQRQTVWQTIRQTYKWTYRQERKRYRPGTESLSLIWARCIFNEELFSFNNFIASKAWPCTNTSELCGLQTLLRHSSVYFTMPAQTFLHCVSENKTVALFTFIIILVRCHPILPILGRKIYYGIWNKPMYTVWAHHILFYIFDCTL